VRSSRLVLAFLLPAVMVLVLLLVSFALPLFEGAPGERVTTPASGSLCGNGKVEEAEQCDDGNAVNFDGCTGCMIEKGFACANEPSVCVRTSHICGNGRIDAGERCDDGNRISADGCSAYCLTEKGYVCHGQPSICLPEDAR
jgi:cysteine-rich repeat protein